ncbi:MAG TPA: tetratricopeptide repeat protein [Pseudolabrys sp.]|jgi:tetratricopeptide (TPR) repeat protein|nr:tetratricopeptide repeat protein [Pseudolabrys sp.]
MRSTILRPAVFVLTGLWLAGCATSGPLGGESAGGKPPADAAAGSRAMASAGPHAVPPPLGVPLVSERGLLGSDPNDELSLGKKQYRAGDYGLAENHFRRAVESHPRDAEAWLGLAASYDQLRRFDLADRAYREAIRIVGRTPAILNNQGYSYMLRGDYPRARTLLLEARARDPGNKFVANNLRLLRTSARLGKAVE